MGKKIKFFRKKNRFTQEEAATILKIPLNTYRSYEQGKRVPRIDTFERIAKLYKCTIEDLI
ncbi:helix-turn-helix transcriptional regulator [Clostridium saccharoperbutylacetonicum]|uniref:helix-turn-helix transcriptional regulator n=1 Tax=Clostridium saccharoperbutylacetonicum TaxID=36745 RepID=UPI0039ED1CB0